MSADHCSPIELQTESSSADTVLSCIVLQSSTFLAQKQNIKWQTSQCFGVSTSNILFIIGYLFSSFLHQISFYQQNSEMEDLLTERADERCSRHCRKLPFSCPTSLFEPGQLPQHSICMPWFCSLSWWTLWGARTATIIRCIMENECDKEIKQGRFYLVLFKASLSPFQSLDVHLPKVHVEMFCFLKMSCSKLNIIHACCSTFHTAVMALLFLVQDLPKETQQVWSVLGLGCCRVNHRELQQETSRGKKISQLGCIAGCEKVCVVCMYSFL